ncbi:MAG: ABC transporter substrate-binding protein [Deltaproteobacteria bacterium]|jgi:ABC-type nitrate/sulfonate/bicarbonate transport system substrate-binding protein|nr:ABC transporter substrate-binding protein [Deltaproteobacteria bacterium]
MTIKKKNKILIIAGSAVVIILIVIGSFLGRTKESVPSQSFEGQKTAQVAQTGQTAQAVQTAQNGGANSQVELKEIRAWSRRDCSLAPWLVTDKLGYFAEEGIKLVFTGELQPPQQIPSILNGDNDVSSAHPNNLAVAINGGAKIKGVARGDVEPTPDVDPGFRHMWWFVNPKKYPNVKTIADLKDVEGTLKFSIISTNQCSDFLAYKIFDYYGIPRDKIEWVTMPDVQAIQALSQGLTDVGGVHPPFYKGILEAGNLKIADSSDAHLEGQTAGLTFYYFTEKFIQDNPETVKSFIKAIGKGQRYINENPEQARLWTEEAIGIPVSANHYFAADLTIKDGEIIPWLEELEIQGVIPKGGLKPLDIVSHLYDKEAEEASKSFLN